MKDDETITGEHDGAAGETDRLVAENRDLKRELQIRSAIYDIQASLLKAGARSPELLANAARRMLQIGEDGQVENAAATVEQLRREFPEQFEAARPVASIDGGAGQKTAPALTKEALSKMSPSEIQRLDWAEVREVLRDNISVGADILS